MQIKFYGFQLGSLFQPPGISLEPDILSFLFSCSSQLFVMLAYSQAANDHPVMDSTATLGMPSGGPRSTPPHTAL